MLPQFQLTYVALGAAIALLGSIVYHNTVPSWLTKCINTRSLLGRFLGPESNWVWQTANSSQGLSAAYICPEDHGYQTEIISLDPLLIYIHRFATENEADLLVRAGEPLLQPSPVTGHGNDATSQARTSWSAPIPRAEDDKAAACVLRRAEAFLGTILAQGRDDIGTAQLVHYQASQKFDLHFDWFQKPRLSGADAAIGRRRLYNRVATFFVVLKANCTGGETYFPHAKPAWPTPQTSYGDNNKRSKTNDARNPPPWREHEDGGVAIRPTPGNALFWVNLFANGSGDSRTLHAGLPVLEGTKTAMNIWPRFFFGPDAWDM